jgi:hypothetical protein
MFLFSLFLCQRWTLDQSPHSPLVVIGDENATERSRLSCTGKERVMQRRSIKQITPLDQRLEEQAKRLRKEAQGTPPGVEREKLIRRARQAETAAHIQEWLSSPGLQPPK